MYASWLSSLAGLHADRQTNMQMNQPVWFVEDRKLMSNEEGKKKLQEVADANSKSQQRLTIVHGSDFDKASRGMSVSHQLLLQCPYERQILGRTVVHHGDHSA